MWHLLLFTPTFSGAIRPGMASNQLGVLDVCECECRNETLLMIKIIVIIMKIKQLLRDPIYLEVVSRGNKINEIVLKAF